MSTFDVVVIGGGPAGMIAAARAAQYGATTVLLEKNKELGKKLMITGRGRCNFAHDEDDADLLAKGYRRGGDFLLPSLRKFGTKEITAFFLRRGIVTAHERGKRLYPKEGQDASSIVNALWTALKDGGVHVLRGTEVKAFDFLGGKARRVTTGREEIVGKTFIIATGGLSFPNTGSTGDGYRWARKAGHTLATPEPALCPIKISEKFDDHLSGLKLKNVRVILQADGQAIDERFGEMDFTPFGISGAIIMDMASAVSDCLKKSKDVTLKIDLKPALDPERLDARIDRDFTEFSADALRFALRKMLPKDLIPEVIKMAKLDMGKPCGETTPEERRALRETMKNFTVTPTGLLGFHHAIITTGGVDTAEIDPETMASKIVPNLFFAGEVIDADGPTGGYNLQECWSTGFIAGSAAAELLGFSVPTDEQIVKQMVDAQNRRAQNARVERTEHDEKNEEELSEDMTIKTGPADDREFCGWRDPRASRKDGDERPPRPSRDSREKIYAKKGNFGSENRAFDREVSEKRHSDFRRDPGRPRFEGRTDGRDFDDRRSSRERIDRFDNDNRRFERGYERVDARQSRRSDGERFYEKEARHSEHSQEYRTQREPYREDRFRNSDRPSYDRETYRRDRREFDDERPRNFYGGYDRRGDYGYARRDDFGHRYEDDRPSRFDDRGERRLESRPDYSGRRPYDERRNFNGRRNNDEQRGRDFRTGRPEFNDRPGRDFYDRKERNDRRADVRSDDARRDYRGRQSERDSRSRSDFRSKDSRQQSDIPDRTTINSEERGSKPKVRRFTNFEKFRNDKG